MDINKIFEHVTSFEGALLIAGTGGFIASINKDDDMILGVILSCTLLLFGGCLRLSLMLADSTLDKEMHDKFGIKHAFVFLIKMAVLITFIIWLAMINGVI